MDERTARMDEELLAGVPEWMALGLVLKASPSEEEGNRFLYFEASNEDTDHQGEVILQKALRESSDYYLRHGNIDLSHYTIMGPKAGIANHYDYEVGRPVAVQMRGEKTFVKAQLYTGTSPMAKNANMVWESLTRQNPPAKWFASVGGAVLAKSVRLDAKLGRVAVVERVRWNNTALDRCPVNKTVGEISTAPIGTFAKSLGGFYFAKSDAGAAPAGLTAGYGTDSATLTGGAAMRRQSLDGRVQSYWDFRDRIAGDVRSKRVRPSVEALTKHAGDAYGLSASEAADWTGRFLGDLQTARSKRKI